jgi:hypothetical protein
VTLHWLGIVAENLAKTRRSSAPFHAALHPGNGREMPGDFSNSLEPLSCNKLAYRAALLDRSFGDFLYAARSRLSSIVDTAAR